MGLIDITYGKLLYDNWDTRAHQGTRRKRSKGKWWRIQTTSILDTMQNVDSVTWGDVDVADDTIMSQESTPQASTGQNTQSPAELEFERQREAFNRIPPSQLAPYDGQFVAVRDGVIVDSDHDPIELSRRFFERYGGVPVFKTRIGRRRVINIPAPFVR